MSADSWTTCPKCAWEEEQRQLELTRRVSQAYGKVWMRGRKCLRLTRFVVDSGGFRILGDYCGTCGKTWEVK